MPEQWYVHIHGETLGPLSFDVIAALLRCTRLMPSDFLWTHGMTSWERLGNLHPFASSLPSIPSVPLPLPPDPSVPTVKTLDRATAEAVEIRMERTPAGEQRRFWVLRMVRVTVNATSRIEGYGDFPVYDISETGMFIVAASPIPVGLPVQILLESAELPRTITLSGRVTRIGNSKGGQKGFAVRFDNIAASDRVCIQELVKSKHVKTRIL